MKIHAKRLADHLARIPFREELSEVVLWGQFEAVARNKEGSLHAWLPPLQGAEPLREEVLIWRLPALIRTLRQLAKEKALAVKAGEREPGPVEFSFTPWHHYLGRGQMASNWERDSVRLGAVMPTNTRGVSIPEHAQAILQNALQGDGGSLLASDLWLSRPIEEDGVRPKPGSAARLLPIVKAYRAKRVTLTIGPTGGEFALCGAPSVSSPFLRMPHGLSAPEAYELEFEARMFASVLVHVRRSPSMRIHLSGLEGPVLFADDDGCSYLVSQNWTPFTVREELRRPESAA